MIPSKRAKFKILLVDDHPLVRSGLRQLFSQEPDLMVCGEAGDFNEAMQAVESLKPDIVIVDISLKGISGIELVKSIKAQYSKLPVLVLSMHDESLYAERALRAGARGYIMKHETTEKVIDAVRSILTGEIYVSNHVGSKILEKLGPSGSRAVESPVELLSDRELEVFQLIGNGIGTSEIAQKLHRSIKTIESYRARIKEKLGLSSATELVHYTVQWMQQQNKA